MIIGLTGYHSCGKSVLAESLSEAFKWDIVTKRNLFKEWSGVSGDDWVSWYRDLYTRMDSYDIMKELIKRINYRKDPSKVIVMDAVHTIGEWSAIKDVDSDSLLIGVFVPKECRIQRSSPEDLILDGKREKYWHKQETQECLLSCVEWSFSGLLKPDTRLLEAEELYNFLLSSGKII